MQCRYSINNNSFQESKFYLTEKDEELNYYQNLCTFKGYYYFAEASWPRKEGDTGRLKTVGLSSTISNICLSFWYFMKGANMGSLNVYVKQESEPVPILSLSGIKIYLIKEQSTVQISYLCQPQIIYN